jgi:hypothetical protein
MAAGKRARRLRVSGKSGRQQRDGGGGGGGGTTPAGSGGAVGGSVYVPAFIEAESGALSPLHASIEGRARDVPITGQGRASCSIRQLGTWIAPASSLLELEQVHLLYLNTHSPRAAE